LQAAIQSYWNARRKNKEKQVKSGKIDAGTRGEVTDGTQMGALEVLVSDILGVKRWGQFLTLHLTHSIVQPHGSLPAARIPGTLDYITVQGNASQSILEWCERLIVSASPQKGS
jgi:hypothetical protein